MRKTALMFAVVFMSIGLLVAGCGGGGGGKNLSSAQKVLDQALKNLKGLKSVKITVKTTAATSGSAPTSAGSANIEVSGTSSHSVANNGGQKIEQYQVGGVTYAYMAGQGWLKEPATSTKTINAELADSLSTGIKDLKILSQDAKSYRLSFKLPASATSAQGSSSPSSAGETAFVVKVDKPTMNVQEISVKASAASSTGTQAQEEVITFLKQNSPITITLPEEAKNAKSVQQQSTPGSSSP